MKVMTGFRDKSKRDPSAGRLLRRSEEEEKALARFGRDDCWLRAGGWLLNGQMSLNSSALQPVILGDA
jgi:hypothetical protein